MASLPVMVFFIILLLPSMLTEGRVLTQTRKEPIISPDNKTNHKADLEKIDSQGHPNIQDAFEMITCIFNQDQVLLEDQTNSNQNKLNLSTLLTALSKCAAHKRQVDTVNFQRMPQRLQRTKDRHQQGNYVRQVIYSVEETLKIISGGIF